MGNDTAAHPLLIDAPQLRCCLTSDENGSEARATTGCEASGMDTKSCLHVLQQQRREIFAFT